MREGRWTWYARLRYVLLIFAAIFLVGLVPMMISVDNNLKKIDGEWTMYFIGLFLLFVSWVFGYVIFKGLYLLAGYTLKIGQGSISFGRLLNKKCIDRSLIKEVRLVSLDKDSIYDSNIPDSVLSFLGRNKTLLIIKTDSISYSIPISLFKDSEYFSIKGRNNLHLLENSHEIGEVKFRSFPIPFFNFIDIVMLIMLGTFAVCLKILIERGDSSVWLILFVTIGFLGVYFLGYSYQYVFIVRSTCLEVRNWYGLGFEKYQFPFSIIKKMGVDVSQVGRNNHTDVMNVEIETIFGTHYNFMNAAMTRKQLDFLMKKIKFYKKIYNKKMSIKK